MVGRLVANEQVRVRFSLAAYIISSMSEHTPQEKPPASALERGESVSPQWIRPTLEYEGGEIDRTARELGLDTHRLRDAFMNGQLEDLTDDDWNQLENTESAEHLTLEEVRGILEEKRDFSSIEEGLTQGRDIYAPAVLFRPGHRPYLIGGNSRLMGCRALNIRPKILAVQMEVGESR